MSLPPPTMMTSSSVMPVCLRMVKASSGVRSSMSQSGGIMSLPPRITMVVAPSAPALMPASRCSMPLPILLETP